MALLSKSASDPGGICGIADPRALCSPRLQWGYFSVGLFPWGLPALQAALGTLSSVCRALSPGAPPAELTARAAALGTHSFPGKVRGVKEQEEELIFTSGLKLQRGSSAQAEGAEQKQLSLFWCLPGHTVQLLTELIRESLIIGAL